MDSSLVSVFTSRVGLFQKCSNARNTFKIKSTIIVITLFFFFNSTEISKIRRYKMEGKMD